jgi:hypothetical protein
VSSACSGVLPSRRTSIESPPSVTTTSNMKVGLE